MSEYGSTVDGGSGSGGVGTVVGGDTVTAEQLHNPAHGISAADERNKTTAVLQASISASSMQQQHTTHRPSNNPHHAQAVQHQQHVHHQQQQNHNGGGDGPTTAVVTHGDQLVEQQQQQHHDFAANCFSPWLSAVTDIEHQQQQQQFIHHFTGMVASPFTPMMMMMPPSVQTPSFDYGGTLVPPTPPPPMAYPTPQGQAVHDEQQQQQQQQHQQNFFGTLLYDSIAATVALAAGSGQFGQFMQQQQQHPTTAPATATTTTSCSTPYGEDVEQPHQQNNNAADDCNNFYVYQHQLNIALGGQYPAVPPPPSSLYPPAPPVEYSTHHRVEAVTAEQQQQQQQHHHFHYSFGAGGNFELYTQHNIMPTQFNNNNDDNEQQPNEFNTNSYMMDQQQQQQQLLLQHRHNKWKMSLEISATAKATNRTAAATAHKKGADGRPKTSKNTSSSGGHLTVPPSTSSRRSSSASTTTLKAHLLSSSATVSPVQHSNGPSGEHTLLQYFPILAQLGPAQRLSPAIVREYLSNSSGYDCVMRVYHARVAQKSYGTEKRFFCPPPCIYLSGHGWKARHNLLDQLYKQHHHMATGYKRSSPGASSTAAAAAGGGGGGAELPQFLVDGRELFSKLRASIVVGADDEDNTSSSIHHMLDFGNGNDYSSAKALFISDSEKRKYFHLHANFGYASGALELGIFPSQKIKVISKPSKKKQSMKSSDCKYLSVMNKSKARQKRVALFNRLRSQTVSTRYLHADPGSSKALFEASSTKWSAFHITVVEQPNFHPPQQQQQHHPVTYGSVIQLVDSQSEMRLPLMRIRKVDKLHVLLDPAGQGEPVSQLHKCAFQIVDGERNGMEMFYLCLNHDHIIQYQAKQSDAHPHWHQISDGAAWTIISTDKTEYRWAEPMAVHGSISRKPVTPVPQLNSLNMLDANQKLLKVDNCSGRTTGSATIELKGTNFTPELRVWFGATPAETIFCTKERLSCSVPSLFAVCKDLGCTVAEAAVAHAANGGKLPVPVLLARDEDGILYPTGHSFPYQLLQATATTTTTTTTTTKAAPAQQSNDSFMPMNGGDGAGAMEMGQHITKRQSSAFAKHKDASLVETDQERFFAETVNNNGVSGGEAQLLLMDNAH